MKACLSAVVLTLACAISPVSAQEVGKSYHLDISREPLESALRDFAQQTGLQIAHFDDSGSNAAPVGPLRGEMSVDAALKSLLSQEHLTYRLVAERTIAVVPIGSAAPPMSDRGIPVPSTPVDDQPQEKKKGAFESRRLAQVGSGPPPYSPIAPMLAATGSARLGEVIVTAQKYSQKAFDVPMSLVVMDGSALQQMDIKGLSDLQLSVPGLYVQSTGVQRRIEIRGVSNIFGGGALVGEYVNEADATASPTFGASGALDLRTYDLQRVEVLRGPQGTLYGQGSIGGAIRLIAKPPALSAFQMDSDVAALFTESGAPSQHIEAVLNTPLVENTLGLRFAGEFDHEGGWVDQPGADQKNINSQNLVDMRIQGLWMPTPDFKVNALQIIHRNSFGPNEGEDANGNFRQAFNLATTPSAEDSYDFSNLTATYEFPAVELVSSTTAFRHIMEVRNEAGIFQATPSPDPLVFDTLDALVSDKDKDFSEELRLAHNGSDAWKWTIGAFYKRFDDDDPAFDLYFGLPGPSGTPLPAPIHAKAQSLVSHSWAVFGDSSYQVERVTIGAGVRYFSDKETLTAATLQSGTFTSVDPRAYIQYQISPSVNIYASAAKGFRSGGFNALGQPPYDPESVWTYEVGTKTRFLGGAFRTDTDVFYSKYSNYVTIGFTPDQPTVDIYRNGGRVTIKGVEGDFTWRPTEGWIFTLSGDYVDGRFEEINVIGSDYNVGDPIDMVPRYTVTGSIERDFNWDSKPVSVQVDYSQRAPDSYRLRSLGDWYYSQSDYVYMLDFHLGIQWSESLRLGLVGKNMLNNRGLVDPFDIEHLAARSQPRTIGFEFSTSLR